MEKIQKLFRKFKKILEKWDIKYHFKQNVGKIQNMDNFSNIF